MSQPKESEKIDGQRQIEKQTAQKINKKKAEEAQTQEQAKTRTKQTKRGKNKSKKSFLLFQSCLD